MSDATNAKPAGDTPMNYDAIVEDLAVLRRDLAALMSQMKNEAFKGASDAAEKTVEGLSDRAKHLCDSVTAQKERSIKAIGRQIEEQPVMSLLIAFGVGYIASQLLKR